MVLVPSLLGPRYLEIACCTLDALPRAVAALEQSYAAAVPPDPHRKWSRTNLRRCIREWELEFANVPKGSRPYSGRLPKTPSTTVMPA